MAIILGIVSFGQSSYQAEKEPYSELQSIVNKQVEALNRTNRDIGRISTFHQEAVKLLTDLPLSDESKSQFLVNHINQELLEVQRRELILKLMLDQLSKQKVAANQFASFAQFLNRGNAGNIDDALMACLISVEEQGTHIFNRTPSVWNPILDLELHPKYTGVGILSEHILESAEQEHWKPFGDSYLFDSFSLKEETEITDSINATQKRILARRYVEETFQK